jgi:hypothetical protein
MSVIVECVLHPESSKETAQPLPRQRLSAKGFLS